MEIRNFLFLNFMAEYITLGNLEVYKASLGLSEESWKIYHKMDWQIKKIIGDQFITSVDSIGANIAEGYGRFHYLDKVKFYYNARGSLLEAKHWALLLYKRKVITKDEFDKIIFGLNDLHKKINELIKSTKSVKDCLKN